MHQYYFPLYILLLIYLFLIFLILLDIQIHIFGIKGKLSSKQLHYQDNTGKKIEQLSHYNYLMYKHIITYQKKMIFFILSKI